MIEFSFAALNEGYAGMLCAKYAPLSNAEKRFFCVCRRRTESNKENVSVISAPIFALFDLFELIECV